MSDPIKQMEIEDVLSSIRRLVADEVAERAVPEALNVDDDLLDPVEESPAEAAEDSPTEKLVLTAALRVPEAAGEEDTAESDEAPEAQESETAEAETDGTDDAPAMPEAEEASEDDAHEGHTEPETTDADEEAPADTIPQQAQADAWEEISLEDRIAELEAAVSDRDEDWEPDGSEEMQAEDIQFTSLRASFSEVKETPQEPVEDLVADDTVAEPAAQEEDAAASSASEAQTEAEAEEAQEAAQDEGASNMFEEESDVMDEEMLRQLVTDIVREELQGTLGERITRNVRKLVRREINTLLATRDFD